MAAEVKQKPDPAAAWVAEFEFLIDELRAGLARKLMSLAENVPPGPGVWKALDAARRAFDLERFRDWPARGVEAAEGEGRCGAAGAGRAAGALVAGLMGAADAALDAGHNDPRDPVVRKSDFGGETLVAPHGLTPVSGPLLLGAVSALPDGHPFRGVDPVEEHGAKFVVLGHASKPLFRLGAARELTAAVRGHRAHEEAERRRWQELAEERRRAEWENSTEGQKARIAKLEAALAGKGW